MPAPTPDPSTTAPADAASPRPRGTDAACVTAAFGKGPSAVVVVSSAIARRDGLCRARAALTAGADGMTLRDLMATMAEMGLALRAVPVDGPDGPGPVAGRPAAPLPERRPI
ncbi:hypothetical protein [Jannaschia sp. LMIT008]|uniref:hypothetical protein n=1 Tax=Jannaschia maritima TaxID=3032585 RepID=UPI002812490C|nr:hypothetical protein [Jannaschia sp. LMIT008]